MKLVVVRGLAWSVLAAALVYFTMHLFDDNNLESGRAVGRSTQQ
jgi:hypothetical protein